ncbi:unnamed protein product [Rotaria sp. Silwood1]|nr:unnamed protein product [Rotaria sp. Silwood1]CAF1620231.1 unnamed protein product [Rotaria sp. Silwood1]CAF3765361.1 unnamed protein product [Rotaria sp. Silwood1]CAF4663105.1 unnamed protein product [Rotaria sp. Silwood1]
MDKYFRKNELEILQNSIENYISPTGFYSTSEDPEIALIFAGDDQSNGVLFEITNDPSILDPTSILVIASIKHFSRFPQEKEVLFGIGTTLQMIVTNKDFQYIQEYIQLKRQELEAYNPTTLLDELIIDIGLYSKTELYFPSIIQTLPNDHQDLPSLYHALGYVYYKKNLCDQAL